MFKQFQKFGFFLSRDINEDTKAKNDKAVKYLYKKEPPISEKPAKRKFDVTYSPKHSRKHSVESKYRSHQKKSKESLVRKPRKRQSVANTNASETEIYFISPEEIKRHRKRLDKLKEHKVKQNDRKSQKREDDVASLIKHQKQNRGSFEKDAQEWLTKKDIFKLLSNVPKNTESSSFLKKFFVFDNHHPIQEKVENEKHQRKVSHHRGSNANPPFNFSADSTTKKLEKISKRNDRGSRQHQEDTHYLKKRHEPRKMEKGYSEQKQHNIEPVYQNMKKPKSQETENRFIFEDLDLFQKDKKGSIGKWQQVKEPKSCRPSTLKVQSKCKSMKGKEQAETSTITRERSDRKLKNECRASPSRHKYCLVKNTFSIVDIAPRNAQNDYLERKKKTKAFKKYYKYSRNLDKDSEISSTYHTFSDCHKLYQDLSEPSAEDISKTLYKRARKNIVRRNLKLETNVSAVVVSPVVSYTRNKESSQSSGGDETRTKTGQHKSKIPVINTNAKIVELATESPTSKGRQKSADLFIPKVLDKERVEDKPPEENVSKTPVSQKDADRSRAKTKMLKTSNDKTEKNMEQRKASTSLLSSKTKPKEKKPNLLNNPKVDRQSSAMSKQSKLNGSGKKTESPTSPRSRNRNISPSPHRKPCRDIGQKDFQLSARDGSSVRSESSKRSNKTSVASKSDTRLQQNSKLTLQKKCRKGSAKTSVSNSTFGDRSIDSSKNGTSFFLTKSFKDDDKLNRWQKQKIYSDTLRKSVINRKQKPPVIPPQVLEVRYLTVSNDNPGVVDANLTWCRKKNEENSSSHESEESEESEECYDEYLSYPPIELIDKDRFQELVELPMDKALDEILNENNDFLSKDFSLVIDNLDESTSSDENISSDDLMAPESGKLDNWYDFHIDDTENLRDISYRNNKTTFQNLTLDDQDNAVDLLSAPGSEESGYATIKSRQLSRNFFDRPEIKALFEPPETSDSYCIRVHIASSSSSSNCGFIQSLHSKSLQASVECLQKSVQIQVSQEIFDRNGFKGQINHGIRQFATDVNVPSQDKTGSLPALDEASKDKCKPCSDNKFVSLVRSVSILKKKVRTKVQKVCGKTKKKLCFLSRLMNKA